MAIARGKVLAKELYIEVKGGRHYMPKGCDPIIGPQLEAIAGHEVEVLMAKDVVLAIRLIEELPWIDWRVILCYLCPPDIVFPPDIIRKIEPLITESLLESGYLDRGVVEQLNEFKQFG